LLTDILRVFVVDSKKKEYLIFWFIYIYIYQKMHNIIKSSSSCGQEKKKAYLWNLDFFWQRIKNTTNLIIRIQNSFWHLSKKTTYHKK